MCCTIIVPIIALLGAYVRQFGTVNIGYRLWTSAKAVRAVLSTPKEDVEAYLASYKIFDTEVMTKENEKFVADYYRVLNHLCAIGDVEKMYIPPVYDLSQGVYANQWIWEEDMVDKLELKPGKHALECGCGRGRIAHHVASYSGAKVTGFNIDDQQQLPQARAYAEETGLLGTQLNFLEHSFNDKFPFEDNTFDAVYHIQALSYSADRKFTLGEIHRVLKPGGRISFLDWFLKDTFDYNNKEHVRLLNRSKPILGAVYSPTIKEYIDILTDLGFEIEINREASKTGHQYELIDNAKEFFMPVGEFTKFLYKIGLASKDTVDLLDRLNENVEDFILGDKMEIFTTSWWIVAKKPEAGKAGGK